MKPKVTVGIISYNDRKYLEHNLPALLSQTYENYEIVVCNNKPENDISDWIKTEFPEVNVVSAGGNVGFGRAHNFMASRSDADYYLCFNSDMVASSEYVENLVKAIESREKCGCVIGKLVSWTTFPESPANITRPVIDTVGLRVLGNTLVVDGGQGEVDRGQYDQAVEVFGASGASPLYRLDALRDVAHSEGEFFDKNFFMYKEDVDLAFRLRWAGWSTWYTPEAVAWHDRTAHDIKGFFNKIKQHRARPAYIKENSFLNQLIVTKKNWSPQFSLITKLRIWKFLATYFLYVLLFDTKTFLQVKRYLHLLPDTKQKAAGMPRRISAREMEAWFGA